LASPFLFVNPFNKTKCSQTQRDGHKPRQTRKSFAIVTEQKITEHPCDIIAEKKVTAR